MDKNDGPAETDIDLGHLPDLVGYVLRRAQIAVFEDFYRTLSPLDLRPTQYSVLLLIGRNPGARQRRVGDALGIQPSNFAVLLDGLVARGLLERRPNPLDRRTVALHLTAAGERLLSNATALVAKHDARMTARMDGAGRARLLALLAVIPQGGQP